MSIRGKGTSLFTLRCKKTLSSSIIVCQVHMQNYFTCVYIVNLGGMESDSKLLYCALFVWHQQS